MIRSLSGISLFALMFLVGCGDAAKRPVLVPVQGTVIFKGQPVEGATVTFSSAKAARSASGITDSSGKFQLTSYDTNDGAEEGEHEVAITKAAASDNTPAMTQDNMKEMMKKQTDMMKGKLADSKAKMELPEKYADPKKSGEKRTVKKGDTNDFKFELSE